MICLNCFRKLTPNKGGDMGERKLAIHHVAFMCDKNEKTIRNWMDKRGFPQPVGGLFDESEVLTWCRANGVRVTKIQGV